MKKVLLFVLLCSLLTSCKDMWDEQDKEAYKQALMESAMRWTTSDTVAKAYCNCVLEKTLKKYPFENDALEHLDELAKDTDLIKCREEALNKTKK